MCAVALLLGADEIKVQHARRLFHEARWVKSPSEIELMRRSGRVGAAALKEVSDLAVVSIQSSVTSSLNFLGFFSPCVFACTLAQCMRHVLHCSTEQQVGARYEFEVKIRGAERCSFPPVVASGVNACTLHYINTVSALRSCPRSLLFLYRAILLFGATPIFGVFFNSRCCVFLVPVRVIVARANSQRAFPQKFFVWMCMTSTLSLFCSLGGNSRGWRGSVGGCGMCAQMYVCVVCFFFASSKHVCLHASMAASAGLETSSSWIVGLRCTDMPLISLGASPSAENSLVRVCVECRRHSCVFLCVCPTIYLPFSLSIHLWGGFFVCV